MVVATLGDENAGQAPTTADCRLPTADCPLFSR